jgi:hypothetical protein
MPERPKDLHIHRLKARSAAKALALKVPGSLHYFASEDHPGAQREGTIHVYLCQVVLYGMTPLGAMYRDTPGSHPQNGCEGLVETRGSLQGRLVGRLWLKSQ